jgi:DNA ligase-1
MLIKNKDELLAYEATCLSEGYEGVMLRDPNGPYKFGRSTENEGYLLKLKRFQDSEAVILEIVEKTNNENVKEKDAFGRSKRSSAMAGLVLAGTMGAFKVKDVKTGIEFGIGSGFTDEFRAEVWANQKKYIGKIVKYKSQEIGAKDAPRFPVFLSMRHPDDMEAVVCKKDHTITMKPNKK